MIEVKDLVKTFKNGEDTVVATNDISFDVPDGQFISIVGRSGAGKSTLLSLLGALDKPTSGDIVVGEKSVVRMSGSELTRYRGRSIGFVFQNYSLVPSLTALENVMLPMEFIGTSRHERIERAKKLLEEVGIDETQAGRRPAKLSGGQQQRVAIARALANRPQLILADEPTGNLDTETGKQIFDLLHSLSRTEKTTIIVVTHDLDIAGKTDRTFTLADGKLTHRKN